MEIYTELEIDELFDNEVDLKDFEKFLREYGINDSLQDVTLKHTKKRLETLIALANEGNDSLLVAKKDLLKKLLENLKDHKEKREELKALNEVYSEESLSEHMDLNELDKHIKHSLREYKKYEHFKKHEQKIADNWIKTLTKKR